MRKAKQSLAQRLNLLKKFFHQHKRLPDYKEMMALFNLTSKGTIAYAVEQFISAGWVYKTLDGKIAPTSTFFNIPHLGHIRAGVPLPADTTEYATFTLHEYALAKPENVYALRVSGDSMIDAGIQPGDTVLIDAQRTPVKGDIVAAYVDGEWTLKYYIPKGSAVWLMPANASYKPITPQKTLEIGGVVVSSIRTYH